MKTHLSCIMGTLDKKKDILACFNHFYHHFVLNFLSLQNKKHYKSELHILSS